MPPIPPSVIGTSSPILADWYTHSQLNVLFDAHGFPGDAPEGNKVEKCRVWLRRGNAELEDALTCFANLIAEMMDTEWEPPRQTVWDTSDVQPTPDPREKLSASLAKEGLTYARGGYIHGAHLRGPTKSLGDRLKLNGMQAVETEFDRAYKSVTFDPPAALTAACAILEAVCKNYIENVWRCPANKFSAACGRQSHNILDYRQRRLAMTTSSKYSADYTQFRRCGGFAHP